MNWRHFLIAIIPNILIIILSCALGEVSFGITFPNLLDSIKKDSNLSKKYFINQNPRESIENSTNIQKMQSEKYIYTTKARFYLFIIYVFYFISIISFLLFFWCWLTAAIIDPGSVINDLKHRKIKVFMDNNKTDYFHNYSGKEDTNDNLNNSSKYLKNRDYHDNINQNAEDYFYCDALSLIRNGQMPNCLLDLPICEICKVPCPPGTVHCSVCRCCVLRRDHHCAVLGQCVGDRNVKCFFLSFIYSAIFCFLHFTAALWYLIKTSDMFLSITNIIIFIFSVYSIVGAFSLLAFDISFFIDFTKNFNINTKNKNISGEKSDTSNEQIKFLPVFTLKMKWLKFLSTLGNSWFERLLPIHNNTTEFAWKGVYWDTDNLL